MRETLYTLFIFTLDATTNMWEEIGESYISCDQLSRQSYIK